MKQTKRFEFYYTITDDQIREHSQRTMKEVFEWIASTYHFINKMQTGEERERAIKIKKGDW